jgi:hypothetical protein
VAPNRQQVWAEQCRELPAPLVRMVVQRSCGR